MKKFLIKISYTLLPIWLICVCSVACYRMAISPNMSGDLGKLGKISFGFFYNRSVDVTLQDTLMTDIATMDELGNIKADVITCGDSFSNQGIYSYQNYMCKEGIKVVNMALKGVNTSNPFQIAYDLMNLNHINADIAPTLLVETVERSIIWRLSDMKFDNEEIETHQPSAKGKKETSPLLETKNWLCLKFGLVDVNPVVRFCMTEECFSGKKGEELYVYYEDLNTYHIEDSMKVKIETNVKMLFDKAEEKGLNLVILVCPDKYDVYQEFIINNPYEKKCLNEEFRQLLGDNENIVIGKELIMPYVHAGEKDMYYQDDTHWSFKSASVVAEELVRLLQTN